MWRNLSDDQPVLIVIGDSYLIGETSDRKQVQRMIMDPNIGSRKELGEHLVNHQEDFYRLYDLNSNYTSSTMAVNSWQLMDAIHKNAIKSQDKLDVLPQSRVDSSKISGKHIIFFGKISELSRWNLPTANKSRIKIGSSHNLLVDQLGGKVYSTDINAANSGQAHKDYGYIAKFYSPSGHAILVISGLGPTALNSMISVVTDRQLLEKIEKSSNNARAFDALIEMDAVGDITTEHRLLSVRPLP
jgi:hypothetical protein